MKKEYSWLKDYKNAIKESDGEFGHNYGGVPFLRIFKKIDDMGASIRILDYFTAQINLSNSTCSQCNFTDVLLYIILKCPPTMAEYNKNKGILTLEWHN